MGGIGANEGSPFLLRSLARWIGGAYTGRNAWQIGACFS